jgi:SnoaL-like domain
MIEADALADIESIKLLKARYCRYLDAKDWAAWRELFADDFVSDLNAVGGQVIAGADEFVAYTRNTIGKPSQPTVHQVHAPEIMLTSPTTARAVWALNDVVALLPALTLHGYGHYDETYEKVSGHWRITSSRLTRLREDLVVTILPQPIARRIRVVAARIARRTSTTPVPGHPAPNHERI